MGRLALRTANHLFWRSTVLRRKALGDVAYAGHEASTTGTARALAARVRLRRDRRGRPSRERRRVHRCIRQLRGSCRLVRRRQQHRFEHDLAGSGPLSDIRDSIILTLLWRRRPRADTIQRASCRSNHLAVLEFPSPSGPFNSPFRADSSGTRIRASSSRNPTSSTPPSRARSP